MAETKKSNEVRDYKEPFEFRLTVGDYIICQRYFKINNFNQTSLNSYELTDAMRNCVKMIDRDLKDKTHVYLSIMSPRYFNSVGEMNEYLSKPENASSLFIGEGIVVKGAEKDYFWDGKRSQVCSYKFDDGSLNSELTNDDFVTYKFSFYVEEQEVNSVIWTGAYPKYVRNSIDLSNKRGRFEGEDLTKLSFEQYLLYKMSEGRTDLVWNLIREICKVCSIQDTTKYTTEDVYHDDETDKDVEYENQYDRWITCVEQEKERRRQYRQQQRQAADKNSSTSK